MIALTLTEIVAIVDGELIAGDADPQQSINGSLQIDGSVQTDSRLVEQGSIFFAMPGEEADGHDFAAAAVRDGAALVIAERALTLPAPVIVVQNGVAALAALAREVVARVRAAGSLTVVAVTGSNGKTTTKNMLRAILEAQAPTVAPPASFNNHVGAPISMLRVDEKTRYLVVEMGASHAGEIAHLVSIAHPDIGIVLAVGRAHLGEFGGIDAVGRAKAELIRGLSATGTAILNIDDARVAAMAELTPAHVRHFGRSGSGELQAENVATSLEGTSFDLLRGSERFAVQLRIVGEHHVMNALAALSAADELGIDLAQAIAAIEGMPRAERWRMEMLTSASGATIINDSYNASPESVAAGLRSLAQLGALSPDRRTIAVLGEMTELGERSTDEHEDIGAQAARLAVQELVVVGARARGIHDAAVSAPGWSGRSRFVETADEAFALLDGELGRHDLVLVKSSKAAELRFLGDRFAGVGA